MNNENPLIVEALRQSHLFSRLTESQLARVCGRARTTRLDEGELLFVQGAPVTCFYLVLSGRIKLCRVSPKGQEKVVEIVSEGGTFAEALMFMDRPNYPVCAEALGETLVVGIDASDFKEMLSDSVETCLLLLGDMSFRLRKLVREIDTLTLQNGVCRVASYFLQESAPDTDTFDLEIAKGVIAARLAVKPETFSRIIRSLREKGVVSIDGSRITIHDRNKLMALSAS